MEKIAIISDIHGNLPALEAVLNDINKRDVSKVICLGDLVGKGPQSKEVIEVCKKTCDTIVAGNWDHFISDEKTVVDDSILWYRQQITEEGLAYLRQLPHVVGFYLSGKYVRLFHAHPHSLFKRLYADSPLNERLTLFEIPKLTSLESEQIESLIVGYGDIHGGYLQYLENGKILFNVGSVGNSCDSIPMASYVILEGVLDSEAEADFSIQFHRVSYDVEFAISLSEAIGLPHALEYAKELRTGVYCQRHYNDSK
ncbi:MAG TPA: metallophosphatase family protein [Firmicutes bacterium]|nr:metallophosphatase family protein [Bacillota bacterium]